ncbi:uncharacterized protein LOC117331906 isoform X2 [Pecten maximus]|uniref:uncharacterized protein LOC117331906 isoform X2 n=1 Tax=Pecten maximus TaxID=6579 RepID=UPI001458A171|nr:uncharacterized protein LOC117331906 isoform X2 [Pecten maximus]
MRILEKWSSFGIRNMFQKITVDIVLEVLLMLDLVQNAEGIGCPKGGPDTMEICRTRSITASSIMLDFYPAKTIPVDKCDCTILIYQGNKLSFNPVSAPDYLACGSEIHIQRYLPRGETRIISCRGATSFPGLDAGNTLTISLKRVHEPYDTSYCYRLDIAGKAASMSLICEDAKTTSTAGITTNPVTITTDANVSAGNHSSQVEILATMSLPSLTGPGTVVMTTVLSITIIYSTIITLLYIMLRRKRQQQDKPYNEIYEEIPSRTPIQNRDSRSMRISSVSDERALPAIPPLTVHRQFSEYNATCTTPPPSANSVSKQTHWNWTYQDKMSNKEQDYINQPF